MDPVPIVLSQWYDTAKWVLEKIDKFPKNQRRVPLAACCQCGPARHSRSPDHWRTSPPWHPGRTRFSPCAGVKARRCSSRGPWRAR